MLDPEGRFPDHLTTRKPSSVQGSPGHVLSFRPNAFWCRFCEAQPTEGMGRPGLLRSVAERVDLPLT